VRPRARRRSLWSARRPPPLLNKEEVWLEAPDLGEDVKEEVEPLARDIGAYMQDVTAPTEAVPDLPGQLRKRYLWAKLL
jgi:hypothetical protein